MATLTVHRPEIYRSRSFVASFRSLTSEFLELNVEPGKKGSKCKVIVVYVEPKLISCVIKHAISN